MSPINRVVLWCRLYVLVVVSYDLLRERKILVAKLTPKFKYTSKTDKLINTFGFNWQHEKNQQKRRYVYLCLDIYDVFRVVPKYYLRSCNNLFIITFVCVLTRSYYREFLFGQWNKHLLEGKKLHLDVNIYWHCYSSFFFAVLREYILRWRRPIEKR